MVGKTRIRVLIVEPRRPAFLQPFQGQPLAPFTVPLAGLAVATKRPVGVALPGQKLGRVEKEALALSAIAHRAAWFVTPVRKAEDAVL